MSSLEIYSYSPGARTGHYNLQKKNERTADLPKINHHNTETDIYDMNNSRNKPSKRASNILSKFYIEMCFMLNENSGFKHQLNHANG